MEQQSLPTGIVAFDFADPESGYQKAICDLAWPNGIQEELSQPVAILLNETADVISLANRGGFRCFTTICDFKSYVEAEILKEESSMAETH